MSEHDGLAHIELKVALGASKHDRLSQNNLDRNHLERRSD
jgi:hypothetical protein